MDHAPKTKRHRHDDNVTSSIQNPNPLPNFDLIISSLLSSPSLSSSPSPASIARSFDQAFDTALASASDDVSDQDRLVDRTVELASLLLDSTKRCFRKRASLHNSNSWAFPRELTIKVWFFTPMSLFTVKVLFDSFEFRGSKLKILKFVTIANA